MSLRNLNNRGDTIIEVMVVLAILGLALSVAYATANRSLLDARSAQENANATSEVQNQIEALRVLGQTISPPAGQNVYITSSFCLKYVPATSGYYVSTTASSCTLPFDTNTSLLVYYCGGSHPGYGGSFCTGMGSDDTFVVEASWPDLETPATDTVTQVYRVHP